MVNSIVTSAFNSSLNKVWELAKADTFEHLILMSKSSGRILSEATGDQDKVNLPDIEFDTKDALVVHSHPLVETGVSLGDILTSLGGQYPVYAITPSKSVTWVDGTRTRATSLLGPDLFEMMMASLLEATHQAFIKRLGWPQDNLLMAQSGVDMDHYGIVTHFATLAANNHGLINYRFYFTPSVEARMDAAGKVLNAPPSRSLAGWRDAPQVEAA